jgi:hypothetical protein
MAGEVLERALDADKHLPDVTKRFIDRHVTAGGKRPPAPSVRREADIDRMAERRACDTSADRYVSGGRMPHFLLTFGDISRPPVGVVIIEAPSMSQARMTLWLGASPQVCRLASVTSSAPKSWRRYHRR